MNPAQATPSPASKSTRRGGSLRWVVVALTLVAVVGGVGAYLYFAVLHPPPRAHLHLPEGSTIAVRVDALQLLAFRPVREKLLPVFENAGATPDQPTRAKERLDRLRKLTGVSLPTDLREVVVGSLDGTQWVAAFGGTLEAGRFVDGLETVLKEEAIGGWKRDGEVLVHTLGATVGQAADGTILVGTTKSIVLAALPARDPESSASDLPLPTRGALTFMVKSAASRRALDSLPPLFSAIRTLSTIDRLKGTFTLDDSPRVDLQLRPRGVTAAELASALQSDLATVKLALIFSPSEFGGARQALTSATIRAEGDNVLVAAAWPFAALEGEVQRLADMLSALLAQTPRLK